MLSERAEDAGLFARALALASEPGSSEHFTDEELARLAVLSEAAWAAADDALAEPSSLALALATACSGRPQRVPGTLITPYLCMCCGGSGRWADGERCHACTGFGVVEAGDPFAGELVQRPPGVRKSPCRGCAFRAGSPEECSLSSHPEVFYCHQGLHRPEGAGAYVPTVERNGVPIGALVCAGWWQQAVEGRGAPEEPWADDEAPGRIAVDPTERATSTMRGTVKWFDDEKGYGFIVPDDSGVADVFVHYSGIEGEGRGRRSLDGSDRVEFDVAEGPKGLQATGVRRVGP